MKRRRFLQSLAAVFTLPAGASFSLPTAGAALPAAAAVPSKARFWAIYMSALHGECRPQALQSILNIPAADAKKYVGQLVADGIIKPNPLLHNSVSEFVKVQEDGVFDKMKKRLDMKAKKDREPVDVSKTLEASETPELEVHEADNASQALADEVCNYMPEELETEASDESETVGECGSAQEKGNNPERQDTPVRTSP